jgi:CPA1 family monovalent cation:H+ antiporter
MIIFEYVLIMLAAVLLSNLINRFVPALTAPLVQIVLGVIIYLLPFGVFGFEFELEPELFFVLFIAPLVFYESYTSDKKTLWNMRRPILGAAIMLVLITVIAVGYITNFLIPAIPLAAAFALIGALGPTDDVAVGAIAKRVAVPKKIMGILSGESIINDASGIVCFQFALAAMMTGSFSIKQAAFRFVLLGIGGLIAGVVLTQIKYLIVKWLRLLGLANVTLHILIEVLTPFIIYMIAENLSVSGILAVFAAGITHSFMRDKFNPETVKLNIAQDSVWEFLTFTFEGIVFVMLGTQLPGILKKIGNGAFPINGLMIAGCILLLTFIFGVLRFLWWIILVRKKTYQEAGSPVSAVKAAVIFSLAGARGAVTLASVMSIPLLFNDGTAFPERELIILLASGVIVISMLIANFILPLVTGRKSEETRNNEEQAACSEIIKGVISRLESEATEKNRLATELVIRNYFKRSAAGHNEGSRYNETQAEKTLRSKVFQWQRENTAALLENGKADKKAAELVLDILGEHIKNAERGKRTGFLRQIVWILKHKIKFNRKHKTTPDRNNIDAIIISNTQYALEKLNSIKNEENKASVEKFSAQLELMSAVSRNHTRRGIREEMEDSVVYAVAVRGFSIERELIQEMFEANRISRETAKRMRSDIATLETQLKNEA